MNSSPFSINVFAKVSMSSSAPSPPTIICSGDTLEYFANSFFNASTSDSGYLLMFLSSASIASFTFGDGPHGFSLDPNLIMSSFLTPNSCAISSFDLPGTYGSNSSTSLRTCMILPSLN